MNDERISIEKPIRHDVTISVIDLCQIALIMHFQTKTITHVKYIIGYNFYDIF